MIALDETTKCEILPDPGVYDGRDGFPRVPNRRYHQSIRVSRGLLWPLVPASRLSPAHFWHRLSFPETPTHAWTRGAYTHALIFEPDAVRSEFLAPMPPERRSKKGREEWAALLASCAEDGVDVVGWCPRQEQFYAKDAEQAEAVAARVRSDVHLSKILQGPGFTETTFAYDTPDGIGLRARPDRLYRTSKGWMMLDLKTVDGEGDAHPAKFRHKIGPLGYYFQAAYYKAVFEGATGEKLHGFAHVVVEMAGANVVSIQPLGESWMEQGARDFTRALDTLRWCLDQSVWPGYGMSEPNEKPEGWGEAA